VNFETFEAVTDKWRLLELAPRLNISIPKTYFISDAKSLESIYPRVTFPAVLKPYRSMICSNGRCISGIVRYASSRRALEETVAKYECFNQHPFLIQEYASGSAQGIFALYDHGKPLVFFAHRRLRERPPSGGVSVLRESIDPNPEALRMARTLLDYVGWHGVAMVELKISAEGTPYLMEVNGRFWGSLQLAIDAGVDFPWLLYQLATGRDLDKVNGYATGVRCRWLLGDLASLYKVLTSNGSSPRLLPAGKAQSVLQFLNFFDKTTRYEVNRWGDLKPFVFEFGQFLRRCSPRPVIRVPRPSTGLSDRLLGVNRTL
jgi:predicted ATP-grasp superfamily ATP-dependent carboligase